MEADKLVHLDPSKIEADDNIRYAILDSDIEAMKSSILELGGITTPVEVEKLAKAHNGFEYRLTTGFRRYRAAAELNKDANAGIQIPAIVRNTGDTIMRLRHQLSENIDRKNLSPMDTAVAIKRLLDAGVTRLQVREMFKRPTGKKGAAEPASNAWLNMTLSFLELPKGLRDKIHSGTVGVAAAYELTRVPADRREEVLERAERERENALAKEQKEEEKYLKAEASVNEVTAEVEAVTTELDHAKAEVEIAEKAVQLKQEEAAKAYKASRTTKDAAAKKAATEAFKALEADAKGEEKKLAAATKALETLQAKQKKTGDKAAELKLKLEEARKAAGARTGKAGRKQGAGVGVADVKKAAVEVGASTGAVKLSAADMRKTIEELMLAGTYPKVAAIGEAIKQCFDGITTPGQMLKVLATITGEGKSKK